MDGMAKYGPWAFMLGLAVAVISGFVNLGSWVPMLLLVLGLIVGLLNVKDKEVMMFLVAGIALTVGLGSLGVLAESIGYGLELLVPIFNNIAFFVGPAIGITALKAIISITRD
ncbi:hypothetical protein HUU53_05090 [Candidatus Micrarchaeota archaeon]|nr:hypothetical protein [Candidatus Micrarchaeota archaeon]